MENKWTKIFISKNNIIASSDKSYLININGMVVWIPHKNVKGDAILQINLCLDWNYSMVEGDNQTGIKGEVLAKLSTPSKVKEPK